MSYDLEEDDFVPAAEDVIRERIIHVLSIYSKISPSMLQVGIGTALSPNMWRPVLNKLLRDGIVLQGSMSARGPTGRDQTYQFLTLAPKKLTDGAVPQRIDDSKAL